MKKIVTFGEVLLRLTPPNYKRFIQANSFEADYGGAEANVAISLSRFGHDTHHISSLPDNPIGESALESIKKSGVNIDNISRDKKRIGVYYHEKGFSLRPSKIIYDRKDTSFSNIDLSDFDLDSIFKDANWFHFSGISPALGEKPRRLLLKILKYTKKYNILVSCDLNFRKNLWSPEEAQKHMIRMFPYVDICIDAYLGNDEDMPFYNKHNYINTDMNEKEYELHLYEKLFKQLIDKYNFKYIVSTIRESHSASDNTLSACGHDGSNFFYTDEKRIRIVDRIGGGDSFSAGLIHSLIEGDNLEKALDFGLYTSILKHTIHGDSNMIKAKEAYDLKADSFLDMILYT